MMPPTGATSDLLGQFLKSEDQQVSEKLLSRIVNELVEPLVSKIVASRIVACNVDDVRHDVLAELIGRLRDWKDAGSGAGIRDLRAYVAVAARNGCDEYYRRQFPQRFRLQKRLRYLLTRDRRFAIWEGPLGEWVCGRCQWLSPEQVPSEPASEFTWESSRQTADLVDRIFGEAGAPIPFDDLVGRVAHHWGIVDHAETNAIPSSPGNSIHDQVEIRAWLKQFWVEVGELPARQRAALLYSMRDDQGGSALALLPLTGIATLRQIAASLGLEAEELARIWHELPWDDRRIGQVLSLTRQQVAGLRKSARERLIRRLR
jgi:hypothetical protein